MPALDPISRDLLVWYDRHRRALPWRAVGATRPDPYAVWLSEIMLQQTTVAAVKPYYEKFLARWPDVAALAAAPREEVMRQWAGLGYYARARNLHDCAAAVVARHGGRFPAHETELRDLPGIGDYTAAAIAAIAFGERAAVVDGNVERVMTRLFAIETPLPAAKPIIRRRVEALVPADRPGDFAQSLMDFGATLCTPKSPGCTICPLASRCAARAAGDPTRFPRRLAKKPRPTRRGAILVLARRDGAILVRTRPSSGLLGGMTEFCGTAWSEGEPDLAPLCALADSDWQAKGMVEHVFTHFALQLSVYCGQTARDEALPGHRWVRPEDVQDAALPSLMRKVWRLASTRGRASALVSPGFGLIGLEGADEQARRDGEDRQAETRRGTGDRHDIAESHKGRGHAKA